MLVSCFCHIRSNFYIEREHFLVDRGSHAAWALLCLTRGRFACTMGGESFCAGAGDAVLFPADMPFVRQVTEPLTAHYIQFSCTLTGMREPQGLLSFRDSARAEETLRLLQPDPAVVCQPSALWDHLLNDLMYQLYRENTCLRLAGAAEVEHVIRYMEERLAKRLTLEELAREAGLSKAGLIGKFKKQTGSTPMEYLSKSRLERAKAYLLMTDRPVSWIAEECGFENQYYFSNFFKKRIGLSPIQFRHGNLL